MTSGARRAQRRADDGPHLRHPRRVPPFDIRVDQEILEAAETTLATGWWSMGAKVADCFTASRDNDREFPVTDSLANRILTLPLYAHLEGEGVEFVSDTVLRAVDSNH